jgi:nicotinamidase-related amidase
MNRDLGVWTSEDSALVLIDYQAELLEAMLSETGADLVELHARWLAKTAKAFDMPIVLSTCEAPAQLMRCRPRLDRSDLATTTPLVRWKIAPAHQGPPTPCWQ